MGASGVCVGRPLHLGAGGVRQPGVERVLELLRIELRAAMQQVGAPTISISFPRWCAASKNIGIEKSGIGKNHSHSPIPIPIPASASASLSAWTMITSSRGRAAATGPRLLAVDEDADVAPYPLRLVDHPGAATG